MYTEISNFIENLEAVFIQPRKTIRLSCDLNAQSARSNSSVELFNVCDQRVHDRKLYPKVDSARTYDHIDDEVHNWNCSWDNVVLFYGQLLRLRYVPYDINDTWTTDSMKRVTHHYSLWYFMRYNTCSVLWNTWLLYHWDGCYLTLSACKVQIDQSFSCFK